MKTTNYLLSFITRFIFLNVIISSMMMAHGNELIELNSNIASNTKLLSGKDYIIRGEIHVLNGITVEADDNVKLMIVNGNQSIKSGKTFGLKSGLVFDTGSSLIAKNLYILASDTTGTPVTNADNAGIFFMGSSTVWQRGQLKVNFATRPSSFTAESINVDYLGRSDLNNSNADKYAAIHAIGIDANEWRIATLKINHPAYYALQIERSAVELRGIDVQENQFAGIKLFDTRLDILQNLTITPSPSATSKQLFDFTKINSLLAKGPSRLRLLPGANINISGDINSWVTVLSDVLPKWDPLKEKLLSKNYSFTGNQGTNQSYIYSTLISSN